MKSILALLIFFSLSWAGLAQENVYTGVHGGLDFDQWIVNKRDPIIAQTPVISGSFGFRIGFNLNDYFSIESGVTRKYYNEGYGIFLMPQSPNFSKVSSNTTTFQIPVAVRVKITSENKKWFFVSEVGVHFCSNTEYGLGAKGKGNIQRYSDTLRLWEVSNKSFTRNFTLLNAGIGLE